MPCYRRASWREIQFRLRRKRRRRARPEVKQSTEPEVGLRTEPEMKRKRLRKITSAVRYHDTCLTEGRIRCLLCVGSCSSYLQKRFNDEALYFTFHYFVSSNSFDNNYVCEVPNSKLFYTDL